MKIKNWAKFQHFKDRRPPWIKLYRDLLDDKMWHDLDPVAAKGLIAIWLLASESEGRVLEEKTLAFRMRISELQAKTIVSKLGHWLEHDDINAISPRYPDDPLERETETYKEETETDQRFTLPDWVDEVSWKAWLKTRQKKKASNDDHALSLAVRDLAKLKAEGHDPKAVLENSILRGYTGLFPPKGSGPFSTLQAVPDGSIICRACGVKAFTYTDFRCDPCYRAGRLAA